MTEINKDTIWDKIQQIPITPLRLLFILLIIAPLVLNIQIPLSPSTPTRQYYDFIRGLPDGSVVLFDSQLYGWNYGDCAPGAAATMNLILNSPNNLKLVVVFEGSDGPLWWKTMQSDYKVSIPSNKQYGVDYVQYGWYLGDERGFTSLLDDFWAYYPQDYFGTATQDIPMMQNIHSGKDFAVCISSTSLSALIDFEVRQAYGRYNIPLLSAPAGMTVMSVIPYYPYAVKGYITGLSGAAQLEAISGRIGLASLEGNSFSFMTLEAFALAILGIVGGYMTSRRGDKK
jgi:hypothetical protein